MNSLRTKKILDKARGALALKSLGSEAYRERFDFRRLEKISKEHNRLTRYEQKLTIEKNSS